MTEDEALRETHAALKAMRVRADLTSFRLSQLEAQALREAASGVGPKGDKGDLGPMPKHRWNGTALQFQQGPDGDEWGKSVDLKGPKGEPGIVNVVGGGGGNTTTNTTIVQVANSYFPGGW